MFWANFFKLAEIWYKRRLLYADFDFSVYFFEIFVIHIFLEKFWSQNLKFSKSTEIWCRRTLLHAYCKFYIYFFKISVSHIFLGKFGPIIWSSTKWLKVCTLLYAYYDFNVYFFKILSFIQFWVNLVQKSNILQIYWNMIQGYIVICWLRFSCVVFPSVSRSEIFGAKIIPKSYDVIPSIWKKGRKISP